MRVLIRVFVHFSLSGKIREGAVGTFAGFQMLLSKIGEKICCCHGARFFKF